MRIRPARSPIMIAGIAAAMALGGCGVIGGDDPGPADPSGGQSQDPDRSPPPTLAPELQECGSGGEEQLTLADTDLTEATWDVPDGFETTGGYHEDNPVEDNILDLWVAKPTDVDRSLNIVNVVTYDGLDWGDNAEECSEVPLSAVGDRLGHYRQIINANALSDPEMTEVDGYPAMQQSLEVSRYSYEGYWLFSTTQLLHVYCQWDDDQYRDIIMDGCEQLVDSVSVP